MGTLPPEALEPLTITIEDFDEAIKRVQPSAKREGCASLLLNAAIVVEVVARPSLSTLVPPGLPLCQM